MGRVGMCTHVQGDAGISASRRNGAEQVWVKESISGFACPRNAHTQSEPLFAAIVFHPLGGLAPIDRIGRREIVLPSLDGPYVRQPVRGTLARTS